eukprot:6367777-Amphidinium_carterae.2
MTSSLARAGLRPVDFIAATIRLICQESGGDIEATKAQAISGTRAGALKSLVFVISLKGYSTPTYPAWHTSGTVSSLCAGCSTQ